MVTNQYLPHSIHSSIILEKKFFLSNALHILTFSAQYTCNSINGVQYKSTPKMNLSFTKKYKVLLIKTCLI